MSQSQQQTRLAVVTTHDDACLAFSSKIFKFAGELERLGIKYNIALVPFFNEMVRYYSLLQVQELQDF
jgi:hypothetical protein